MNRLAREAAQTWWFYGLFQEVHKAVTEVPLVVNGGNLKVSFVLLRCCILQTALECSLCENAVS